MPQLRQDFLTGRWVIFAPGRQKRPSEFALSRGTTTALESELSSSVPTNCPFCPGNEDQTTEEILATGRPEKPKSDSADWRLDWQQNWRIRVFPNMYPALMLDDDETAAEASSNSTPNPKLRNCLPGKGDHEVVVFSPRHRDNLSTISVDHLAELLGIVRDRIVTMAQSPGCRYVLPFCNHGPQAGATREHPHLQIISTFLVPTVVVEKSDRFVDYEQETGRCMMCETIGDEQKSSERVIYSNKSAIALTPWASRVPFEMLITPLNHRTSIVDTSDEEIFDIAECLSSAMSSLVSIFGDPSVNVVVHNAPLTSENGPQNGQENDHFHWHIEVLPRLSKMAGFEAGTGLFINSILPEKAAERLRMEGK